MKKTSPISNNCKQVTERCDSLEYIRIGNFFQTSLKKENRKKEVERAVTNSVPNGQRVRHISFQGTKIYFKTGQRLKGALNIKIRFWIGKFHNNNSNIFRGRHCQTIGGWQQTFLVATETYFSIIETILKRLK